ncbi:MAG: glycosyl transferase family 28 [Filimonas sp.]|nr:glycosyl transferase family 28 [Filimonas sp.]
MIKQFETQGCKVIVAAEGASSYLLSNEFPNVTILPLRGYRIRYTKYKRFFAVKILLQIPQILAAIRREHQWLQKAIIEHDVDLVISDNRFGFWSPKTPSVFITHQLAIEAPFSWLKKIIQRINYKHIGHFTECWVPDFQGSLNIAGDLSHPAKLPGVPTNYIGPLSRFEKRQSDPFLYKWLFVLSGPEPQRSLLEAKILTLISSLEGNILLVRAKPGSTERIATSENCTVKNHLSNSEMEAAFSASQFIVSRAGYTTVMELLTLGKKSVLIPTPGQTEQEYLAKRLFEQQWCYTCGQDDDISSALQMATTFNYRLPTIPSSSIAQTVVAALQLIPKKG